MTTRYATAWLGASIALLPAVAAANPLSFIGETYAEWKERLFGGERAKVEVVDAPAAGTVQLPLRQPLRVRIGPNADERDFPKGKSRYRLVELPEELERAAVRIQTVAGPNPRGRGNAVLKPFLYVYDRDGKPRDPVEAKPLHLDIRPLKRTRLLACVTLDHVRRFAVATTPDAAGKSYESEVREAVKAPTPGGFYYTTDAIKTRLPYAATGIVILEVMPEAGDGNGC